MPRHRLKPSSRRRPTPSRLPRIGMAVVLILLLGVVSWWGWRQWSRPAAVPGRGSAVTPPPPVIPAPPVGATSAPVIPTETPRLPDAAPSPVAPVEELPPPPPEKDAKPEVVETPKPAPPAAPVPRIEADWNQVPNRPPTNILEAQIALTAYGIGSGSIDGIGGAQTAWALKAFQFQKGLEETGRLDRETQKELKFTRPLYRQLVITSEYLAGLAPVPSGWLEKSSRSQLGHETLLERIAERSHAHPNLLRRLNPSVRWESVQAGTTVIVPNAAYPPPRKAALVRISLANRYLRAFDGRGNLLAHFPCSIGRIAEKRPVGELHAAVVVKDPNYTFDPKVFPESPDAQRVGRKLIIPPGPNNPVGVAWIGLSRPGYGIHGTPIPEQVGRTESHGCFRLANWNAEYLRQMMSVGTPVWVEL